MHALNTQQIAQVSGAGHHQGGLLTGVVRTLVGVVSLPLSLGAHVSVSVNADLQIGGGSSGNCGCNH
ncbi:MAG: hypothetical protein RJB60_802 [Pseudomonadota bacterium]|jgi:hypothetical protein